jgi:magnesium chelatase family protein
MLAKSIRCRLWRRCVLLKQHCKLTQDSQELIQVAMNELNLSARAYDHILKVSRAIADLDGKADISPEHVSEAIQ